MLSETRQERARRLFASVKEKQMWVDVTLGEGNGVIVRANYDASYGEVERFVSGEKDGKWEVDMDMHVGTSYRWLVLR